VLAVVVEVLVRLGLLEHNRQTVKVAMEALELPHLLQALASHGLEEEVVLPTVLVQ
jgi:hypothetical protein